MAHYPLRFGKQVIRANNIAWNLRDAAAGGFITDAIIVQKFGENGSAAATEEPLWSESGAYTWMSSGQQLKVASVGGNAANDDGNPEGTGAWNVEIQGLDSNWDLHKETIVLNGANQVTTTDKFRRCFRAKVLQAGSGGTNDEPIHIYDNGGVNQVAHIPADYAQTMQAIYTIPRNYTGRLLRWYASSAANQTVDFFLRIRNNKIANSVFQVKHKIHIFRTFADERFETPIIIPEMSDIYMSTVASAAADVAGGFDLILIKTGG